MSLISTLNLAADTPSAEFATLPGAIYTLEASALCLVEVKTNAGDWLPHYQPMPLVPSSEAADRAGSFIAPTLFARVRSFGLAVVGKVYSVDLPLTDAQLRAAAVPISLPSTALALSSSLVTTSGTVTAGAKSVLFCSVSGSASQTVDGQAFTGNLSIEAPTGFVLPAIAYNPGGNQIVIRVLR